MWAGIQLHKHGISVVAATGLVCWNAPAVICLLLLVCTGPLDCTAVCSQTPKPVTSKTEQPAFGSCWMNFHSPVSSCWILYTGLIWIAGLRSNLQPDPEARKLESTAVCLRQLLDEFSRARRDAAAALFGNLVKPAAEILVLQCVCWNADQPTLPKKNFDRKNRAFGRN